MISYKKINLLDIKKENEEIVLNGREFTIKTPIMYLNKEDNKIKLLLNKHSPKHIEFDNLLQNINRIYNINNYSPNNCIILDVNNTNFYNNNGYNIDYDDIEFCKKCFCELKTKDNSLLLLSLRLL